MTARVWYSLYRIPYMRIQLTYKLSLSRHTGYKYKVTSHIDTQKRTMVDHGDDANAPLAATN